MNWLHMEWIYILVAGFCLVFYWCMHLSSSNSKILVCRLIWLERILSPHPRLPMWFFCWTMFHSNQHQKSCYHFFFLHLVFIVDTVCYRARPCLFFIFETFISSHLFSPHVLMSPSHKWPSVAVVLSFFL